ncbi:MAG: MBL fold metallo-hydrolase [Halioglobus sp.]|nr:MBL fold metallo-hydrolase [Halioglobus sp.]
MQFASLGSGSKGNATLVRAGATLVMVDCGFSLRETTRRLARLGVAPHELDAILVTHEHSDHAGGVAKLSQRHAIPIYLTHGTRTTGRLDGGHDYRCFNSEHSFSIGELAVHAVPVPHDAAEPCQFRFTWGDCSLGILTDLGSITPHVVDNFRSCRSLLLEFNHDLQMLLSGDYPAHLKRRVSGDWGHLNNDQAVDLLRQVGARALDHLVVAHVSEKNNSRELAEQALLSVLDSLDGVVFAQQGDGFDWLQLS